MSDETKGAAKSRGHDKARNEFLNRVHRLTLFVSLGGGDENVLAELQLVKLAALKLAAIERKKRGRA